LVVLARGFGDLFEMMAADGRVRVELVAGVVVVAAENWLLGVKI